MWQMPSALAAQVTAEDEQARAVGDKIETAEDALRLFRLAVPIAGRMEGFFVLPRDASFRALSAPVTVAGGQSPAGRFLLLSTGRKWYNSLTKRKIGHAKLEISHTKNEISHTNYLISHTKNKISHTNFLFGERKNILNREVK